MKDDNKTFDFEIIDVSEHNNKFEYFSLLILIFRFHV